MDFFTAVTSRVDVKRYDKKPVDDKLIGVILYMANHAESAGNTQEWEFIVVKNNEIKNKLYEAALKVDVVKNAPVDIVVCADLRTMSLKYQERGEYLYSIQDTANAIVIMMLTAEFLGLGTNLIRAFDEDKIRQILAVPNSLRPVGIVTLGYPLEKREKPKIKEFEYVTSLDQYKKKYDLSYMFQAGATEEVFKPIVNQILDKLKEFRKRK